MTAWQKWLRMPLWRHSAAAGLTCAAVLLAVDFTFQLTERWFFSFWFDVFLYAYLPVWLYCFGWVFCSCWRWYELSLGVFTAVFLTAWVRLHDGGHLTERFLLSLAFALCSLFLAGAGSWTAWLFRAVCADWLKIWSRQIAQMRKANLHR